MFPLPSEITAIIPAHNEAAHLSAILKKLNALKIHTIVIDDGSTDETATIAHAASATIIQNSYPKGKTASIVSALRALPETTQWILCLDGDGQHNPDDLPAFFEAAHDADIVIGNRMNARKQMPLSRRWANRLMTSTLNSLTGGTHPDTQCGYRLIRRACLGTWLPKGAHFEWESELYLYAMANGLRITSVPIACIYGTEVSSIAFWADFMRFLKLIATYIASCYINKPMPIAR